MTLDVPAAIEDGLARIVTRVAAVLLVLHLLLGAISTVTARTLAVAALRAAPADLPAGLGADAATGGAGVPVLDVSLPVATLLFLVQVVAAQAVAVVTIRTFVSDARQRFPRGIARQFTWVVLNALVAGFVVNLLIGLGTVLLVLPGVYLAVALYFVQYEVVVEGTNAFDALRDGWALTGGDRLVVFLLIVVVVAIGLASAVPGVVLGFLGVPSLGVVAVSVVFGAVAGVVSAAVAARAYVQLKPSGWSPPDATPSPFAH